MPVESRRAYIALTYDARDGYVLAFGGRGPSGALGDTWKFAYGNWTLLLTSISPSPRWGAAMTYDAGSSSVILFGGANGTGYLNDTWRFDGGAWTELNISGPSPRAFAAITYDGEDGYTVLYGGGNGATVFGDTWDFHNGSWTKLVTSGSIPASEGSAFAFDPALGYTVLFGGVNGSSYYGATYYYRGTVWSLEVTSGPSLRAFAGMAYDRSNRALVLFGGNSASTYFGDTWEFNKTWDLLPASPAPGPRTGTPLAFDGLHPDLYITIWGGVNASGYAGDSWRFTGTGWVDLNPGGGPPALTGAVLVEDIANGYAVLFGGIGPGGLYSSASWIFQGGVWKNVTSSPSPSPRAFAAAAYLEAFGVILFGGYNGSAYLNDTWQFANGSWKDLTSGLAPSPRDSAGFALDGPISELVLFGGYNGTGYLRDTWKFNGNAWSAVAIALPPPARSDPMAAEDVADGYVILFGGTNGSFVFNDTWIFRGNTTTGWVQLHPTLPLPPARYGARASFDPFNGYVVMSGGRDFSTAFNDTWGFLNGSWNRFSPPLSPPVRSDAALTYDRVDSYIVQFGGADSSGSRLSDTWLWVSFIAQVAAFPAPTDIGIPVLFSVVPFSGVPPYTYSWSFGDGGTNTTQNPSHQYLSSGSFVAAVTVGDLTSTTSANLTLVVNPTLTVTGTANRSSVWTTVVNYTVQFNATTTGGTVPLSFSWSFGDGIGATTQNATHAYTTTGTFNATVFVHDSAGASTNFTVPVHVYPVLAATVTPTAATTDVGASVAFTSIPIGGAPPYTYSWLWGDGSASTVSNPSHAYAVFGTYLVNFWLNDSARDSFTTHIPVTVVPPPTVSIVVLPRLVDVGVPVTFNGTASNGVGPFTYFWTFGDGSSATTALTNHTYGSSGAFRATFVATDSLGLVAQGSANITVAASLTVSSSANPSATEVGVSVAFRATPSGGVAPISYAWVFGDGGISATANASHTYAATGTFMATVWANDTFGSSAHHSITVTVSPRISAAASSSRSTTDLGVAVSFVGNSSGGVGPVSYAWAFGDGSMGSGTAPAHTYTAPGTYRVLLWANDSLAVSAEAMTNVSVAGPLTLTGFTVSPSNATTGTTVTFSGIASGGTAPYSYAYSGLPAGCSTTDQPSLTCSPSAPGAYVVRLTVVDSLGQSTNATATLGVSQPSPSTFLGLPTTEGYLLLLAIVVIACLILWGLWGRRRRPSGTSESPSPSRGPTSPETPANPPANHAGPGES